MSSKKNIILLLLTVLSFNSFGQYLLLKKGEKSPYDSGVLILLSTYRHETEKMREADRLIKSLKNEIDTLRGNILHRDSVNKAQSFSILKLVTNSERQSKTIQDLNKNFDKLYNEATKPKKWYEKPVVWLGAFAVYEVTTSLIKR